jgi:hypothetical protein
LAALFVIIKNTGGHGKMQSNLYNRGIHDVLYLLIDFTPPLSLTFPKSSPFATCFIQNSILLNFSEDLRILHFFHHLKICNWFDLWIKKALMQSMNWRGHIVIDPAVLTGEPVIKGTYLGSICDRAQEIMDYNQDRK